MMDAGEYAKSVLPDQEEKNIYYLDKARAAAIKLAQAKGTITIDDVWDVCPPPSGIDPRILGGVFRRVEGFRWEGVGYQKSRRSASNHGRPVAIWSLIEDPAV